MSRPEGAVLWVDQGHCLQSAPTVKQVGLLPPLLPSPGLLLSTDDAAGRPSRCQPPTPVDVPASRLGAVSLCAFTSDPVPGGLLQQLRGDPQASCTDTPCQSRRPHMGLSACSRNPQGHLPLQERCRLAALSTSSWHCPHPLFTCSSPREEGSAWTFQSLPRHHIGEILDESVDWRGLASCPPGSTLQSGVVPGQLLASTALACLTARSRVLEQGLAHSRCSASVC